MTSVEFEDIHKAYIQSFSFSQYCISIVSARESRIEVIPTICPQ